MLRCPQILIVCSVIVQLILSQSVDDFTLRIVAPREGQRFVSGAGVRVLLGVEPNSGSEYGSEQLLVGFMLRLRVDEQPAQVVAVRERIWVDFSGLFDGWHNVHAEIVDEKGNTRQEVRSMFEVGPPLPSVTISYPLNGSFVNDDPITVLFFRQDFDLPGDGALKVDLDGLQVCWLQDGSSHHCDLKQVTAGPHSVQATLLRLDEDNRIRSIAAIARSTFVVRRPDIAIVSPTRNGTVIELDQRNRVPVRFTILNLAPQCEVQVRVQVGRSHITANIVRSDHYILSVPFDLQDLSSLSEVAEVPVQISLYDVDGDDVYDKLGSQEHAGVGNPSCRCADASCHVCKSPSHYRLLASAHTSCSVRRAADAGNGAASARGGREESKQAADEARHVHEQRTERGGRGEGGRRRPYNPHEQPHALAGLAGGCRHVFMDVGTNDGASLHRFMEPARFWERAGPLCWFKNLTMLLPPTINLKRDFCLLGFEGNPNLTPVLKALQRKRREEGWNMTLLTDTLAWHSETTLRMRLDWRDPEKGLASSVMAGHPDVQRDASLHKDVPAIDLGWFLRSMRQRLPAEALLVIKMDIEGAEYEVLKRLAVDGTLCETVDLLLMEWHPGVVEGIPQNMEESMGWLLEGEGCRTKVWQHCESE